jgi:uncharacterized membrane protein YbhN (UPF0104 family)
VKIKLPGYAKALIKAALTIAALWFVFSKIPLGEVLDSVKEISVWPLIPALLAFILSKYLSALRLWKFFELTGIRVSQGFNLRLYLLGMFYNLFLPGGIGGDGYKIFLLNRRTGVKAPRILWTVLADRASGLLALVIIGLGMYYLTPLKAGIYQNFIWLLIPVALFAAFLALKYLLPDLRPAFWSSNTLSAGVQLAQLLSAWLILKAIGGTEQMADYLFLFLVSSIVAMLPLTIGGIGSRELTFLLGSGMLGLDTGKAVALSLIFYLISMLVSFSGIYYMLRPGDLKAASVDATLPSSEPKE